MSNGKYEIGTIFKNNKGLELKIVDKLNAGIREVEFVNSRYRCKTTIRCIQIGQISDKSTELYAVGNKFNTTDGYEIEIIYKINSTNRMIRFNDKFRHEMNISISAIKDGNIKNPYHPSVLGVGYLGVKVQDVEKDKHKAYQVWFNMLSRCYDKNIEHKYPTYNNTTVSEDWKCFSTFYDWFCINYIEGYHLDKDLLNLDSASKEYGAKSCLFIPPKVNIFLTSKKSSNSTGYRGVCFDKNRNKYIVSIHDFNKGSEIYLGRFYDIEEANLAYIEARKVQVENVKQYMRKLGHWSEDIIQLIK